MFYSNLKEEGWQTNNGNLEKIELKERRNREIAQMNSRKLSHILFDREVFNENLRVLG